MRTVPAGSYRFLDFVEGGMMPCLYSAASVYVMPSVFEPFGYSLVEAMSCGRPVVASRVGGICELVEEGKSGLLVSPRSPRQLADAIVQVLEDEALAKRLGDAARARVLEQFSLERFGEGFERAMRAVAG